jgi:uncharacterized protein YfaS (alpha-2-macroglobulin family)
MQTHTIRVREAHHKLKAEFLEAARTGGNVEVPTAEERQPFSDCLVDMDQEALAQFLTEALLSTDKRISMQAAMLVEREAEAHATRQAAAAVALEDAEREAEREKFERQQDALEFHRGYGLSVPATARGW